MKILTNKGISILFISHRLDEVMAASDKIVILRDGEQIADTRPAETTIEKIAEIMVGRKIESTEMRGRPVESIRDDYILQIRDLSVAMPGETVKTINLDVKRGEILGIGGLAGQGKIGIANGIMGLFPSAGTVRKNDKPVLLNNAHASMGTGMSYVS